MNLRPLSERLLQAAVFEAVGLAIVVPAYALVFGAAGHAALATFALVTFAALSGAPLHNAAFDRIEWHLTGRPACRRPARWRAVHAVTHEISLLALTIPIFAAFGHCAAEILALNIGLTGFYVVYTAAFHAAWDRLRPVGSAIAAPRCPA